MQASAVTDADHPRHHAEHRAGWLLAWQFQITVLLATILAGALTALARTVWYFPIDVEITRDIQAIQAHWLLVLFQAVSWVGFPPQSNYIFGAVILVLFLIGLRLEAVMTLFAAVGSAGLWYWISALVDRPRPSPDLVNVAMQLPTGGFPSGHVLNLTAIFGFLIYLSMVHVRPRLWRRLLVVLLALPILTIGVARVYDGAHWPSDVLGGYLIGGIWLALTIQIYRSARRKLADRRGSHSEREDHVRPEPGSTVAA